jgi:predicted RNase H-like nuclease
LLQPGVNGRTRYHASQLGVKKFLHGFTLECRAGGQFIPNLLGHITNCDLNAHACIMPALRALCKHGTHGARCARRSINFWTQFLSVGNLTVVDQTQPIVAGVDGCPGGWLALVECKDGQPKAQVFSRFNDLANALPEAKVIAVDIPIGLPEVGARACDEHARRELAQPRGSSVFPAPLRAVLAARLWEEACTIRLRIDSKRMSKQAWGIVPKVQEVDALLRENANLAARVFEVHPEVSFAAWAGRNEQRRMSFQTTGQVANTVCLAGAGRAMEQQTLLSRKAQCPKRRPLFTEIQDVPLDCTEGCLRKDQVFATDRAMLWPRP